MDVITAETDAPKLIEATHLSMFVKLAQAKQDVIAGLSTKERDSRVRRKRAATLIDFWGQLHMVQNITPRLFDSLTHELDFFGQTVEQLANELFCSLRVATEACSETMTDELDLEVRYNKDPMNAEAMFKVCMSASAKAFEDRWSMLVKEHEAVFEITQMFAEPAQLMERVDAISSNYCDGEGTYCRCRRKVCEAVALAATWRLKEAADKFLWKTRSDVIKEELGHHREARG